MGGCRLEDASDKQMRTSVVEQPPHIDGALWLLLLKLPAGLHQLLIHPGDLRRWGAAHGHWNKQRDGGGGLELEAGTDTIIPQV